MKIAHFSGKSLTADHVAAWGAMQAADARYSSPFFTPEFTQLVAHVRDDVEVAVLEDGGEPVGFFPYQRRNGNVGYPVGGRLSDFHGVVAKRAVEVDPLRLLRECRLSAWHFDHLVDPGQAFGAYAWTMADSPWIDISGGFERYIASRPNGRRMLSRLGRKRRKLERDFGPLRFEALDLNPDIIPTFLKWKGEQLQRTHLYNIFRSPWVVDLLYKLLDFRSQRLSAVVSVLYVDDRITSINIGMRSGTVLHPWFPTYDVALGRYSPGLLHWIEILTAAPSLGICRIDLGKGTEPYKRRFMTGNTTVVEGSIDDRWMVRNVRRAWHLTHHWVRKSSLGGPARVPWRWIGRMRDQFQF